MCEINPKHKKIFRLEFFAASGTLEEFEKILYEQLLELEVAFNSKGNIRVHVHDSE